MRHLTFLILAALLGQPAARPTATVDEPQLDCFEPASPTTLTGTWTLTWDDTTNLELASREKVCRVALDDVHGTLVGRFEGPVLGSERAAAFTGEALPGGPRPVVVLFQREEGYTCAYQLTRESAGLLRGTWRDSRGAGGTVELTRDLPARHAAEVIVRSGDR